MNCCTKEAKTYHVRALAYALKGQIPQAIADCDKALAIDPENAMVYWNKAAFLELAARFRESLEAYKAFVHYASPEHASRLTQARKKISELEASGLRD